MLGLEPMVVRRESPEFDFDENVISVTMEVGGVIAGEALFGQVVVSDNLKVGIASAPVFDRDHFAAFVFRGPATRTRIITKRFRILQGFSGNPLPRQSHSDPPNGVVTAISVNIEPVNQSLTLDNVSFNIVDRVEVVEILYFSEPGTPRAVGQPVTQHGGFIA